MTITFGLILGHWAWTLSVTYEYTTWESRVLKEEEARLDNYTIEDLYRDSPTETPFRKMVVTKASDIEPKQDRRRRKRDPYAVNVHPPGWSPSDDAA